MLKISQLSKLVLGAAAVLLIQGGSLLAGDQDFTLTNKTGVEIHGVFVSPHSADDWEEDILGKDTLPDGESVEITFEPKEKSDLWDLKVTDSEGAGIVWESLKLTEITDVILHYKGGKATAETKNGG